MIIAESLGKRYILHHETNRASYGTLRESLTTAVSRLVRTSDVRRGRDEFWALRDVSFRVREGEAVGIIGHNGAGKSTLLKILSRITEPTEGQVRLRGRVASLLEVGTGFHPELTGRENVYLNGAVLGMTRREIKTRFDQIVAFAEVERFLDTPVKRYSSGMFVRLAFAVAAHLEPEVLIVDEVLSVGDAAFQAKCLDRMKEVVRGEGRTVLFVSHNMGAVRLLCPRSIMLDRGAVFADGDTNDVIEGYMKRVLARSEEHRESYSESNQVGIRGVVAELTPRGGDYDLDVSVELFGRREGLIGVGIELTTMQGQRVSGQGSVFTHFAGQVGERVHFTTPSVLQRLCPGRYLVTFWLVQDQMLLREEGMASFEIPEYDLYGNGRILSERFHGPVPIKWAFERRGVGADA